MHVYLLNKTFDINFACWNLMLNLKNLIVKRLRRWHNWQTSQGNSHQQTHNQLWTPGGRRIFNGKEKSGIFGKFYWFFSVFFIKTRVVFFWVGPIASTLTIIIDVHTDFLSLISKFSYLNVVDLADFMMHH